MDDRLREIEEWICGNTQDEGFGGVYERISLGRFLNRLCKTLDIKTILEFHLPFSKGYDNMVFLKNGIEVSATDPDVDSIKKDWPFSIRPKFLKGDIKDQFDLVWNFAVINTNPEILKEMIKRSKKYVLFFTPNFWNYGTPSHIFYHWITGVKCTHAERGSIRLRRIRGMKSFAEKHNLRVIETGYVDMPWWPDTAFGIRDIKEKFFGMRLPPPEKIKPIPGKQYLHSVNNAMFIENSSLPIRYFFAHHQYVLAEKK